MASILSRILMNGGTTASPAPADETATPYTGAYTPEDAISQQYKLSSALRDVAPATSWAGVAAKGLGAVGGNLVQGDANKALANNQSIRKTDILNAANANNLPTLSKALLNAQSPDIQDVGLKTRIAQITDAPEKEFNTRAAMAARYGLQPDTPEYRDFVLTGKIPGMTGEGPYGKAGSIFQNPSDGVFYSVQFGANGKKLIEPVAGPDGKSLQPAKGVSVVGDEMYANATGAPVRNVAPQLVGGEAAKTSGKLNAEGANELPKSKIALEGYEANNKNVSDTIDKAVAQSNGWTTGFWGSVSSNIPGSAANDLRNTLNTVKANLGFDKLAEIRAQSPTGGALGAVSDQEGEQLRAAWASVEQSQSQGQLVENLKKVQQVRSAFAQRKREAYDQDVARFGAANVPNPDSGRMPPAGNSPAPAPGKKYMWSPNGGLQER